MTKETLETTTSTIPDRESGVARYFQFKAYRTNFRTEVLAGLTTFMTMAYILVVHPLIISDAIFLQESGDLFGELVVVTGISAAIGTLIMGLFGKYPFVLAPGMGTNAFFTYSVVLGLGIDWRTALAAVLAEGLSAGLILYPFTKLVSGRTEEVPVVTWILAVIFIFRFIFTTIRFG